VKSHLAWVLGGVIGLGLLTGCSSEPGGPTAGAFTVSIASPNSDDGAVLFTISGGPVDSVEAMGYSLYSARIDANTLRVIVTGDLHAGPIARVRIADERQLSRYSATINQVAMRSTYGQREPTSYALALSP
jgi:hypothetical protein